MANPFFDNCEILLRSTELHTRFLEKQFLFDLEGTVPRPMWYPN